MILSFKSSLIICLLVMICSVQLFAQDVIIMRNGDEIQAQVEEVGQSEIKYKKFENLTGPTYSVSKAEVFMIRYKNGQRDVFKETPATPPAQSPVRTNQPRNVSFSSSDVSKVRTAVTVGYIAMGTMIPLAVAATSVEDGTAIGGVAVLILGATVPIVAGTAGRLRDRSGVNGSPGLRIAAWVAYTFTLINGVVAVGIGASDGEVPDGIALSLYALGAGSLALISAEAGTTARQAKDLLNARKFRISPSLGYMPVDKGRVVPTIGLKIGFN